MLSVVGSRYTNTGKRSEKEGLEGGVCVCTLDWLQVRVAVRGGSGGDRCKSDFEANFCLLSSLT